MVTLRRERRFYVMVCGIACAFCLYFWILKNIQTIEPPKPDPQPENGESLDGRNEHEMDGAIEEEIANLPEPVVDMEELALRRESLEQAKQEYRNKRDRLLRNLGDVMLSLDETKSSEQEMLDAWNALVVDEQGRGSISFTETMVEDYISIRERRSSLPETEETLAARQALLERLLQGIDDQEVGSSLDGLLVMIDELESSVDEHTRDCREIARQAQRLWQRVQDSDRGEALSKVLWQMEAAKVAPDLQRLAEQRESNIADEYDAHFDETVTQTKRDAEARAQQRRAKNEQEARTTQQEADDALAAHESQQQELDAEVEVKQRAVVFKRDRVRIEHYLVPFISLKRTYTTPGILDDEIKEFYWADIPLEQAASLSEIEATGVFESGADSFQQLERFTRSRIEMLDERYLPFGQHWSYQEEDYLILVREILMKYGQAMVEAGLLRP
jgi:hypothetical protein